MAASIHSRYYTYVKPFMRNRYIQSFSPYIFSLISVMVFTVFAIRPTVSTILSLQTSISENRQILDKLDEKAQSLTLGKQNLENIPQEKNIKLKTALPEHASITTLVSNLQNASTKQASASALQIQPVTLIDLSAEKETKIGLSLQNIAFSYNEQGSFPQLMITLENLQNSSRLINIESVVISKNKDGSPILSITGKGYYLK